MKKLCIVLICVAASSLNGMNEPATQQSDPFHIGHFETRPNSSTITGSSPNWSDADSDCEDIRGSHDEHASWSDSAASPAFPHREHYDFAPSPPPYYGHIAALPAAPSIGVGRPCSSASSPTLISSMRFSSVSVSNDPWRDASSSHSSTGHFGVESHLAQGVANMIPSAIRFIEYAPKVLFVGGVTAIGGLFAYAAAQWFKKNNQSGHAHGDMAE